MKLSTLLLSSAALVVAGSAFAADLPAKKGAPAAKATGCPAFGAGFFQIPGGETCIKFGGYARYNLQVSAPDSGATSSSTTQQGRYGFNIDARNNTDIGVIRSYINIENNATSDAYVQFSGLTAGKSAAMSDISLDSAPLWDPGLAGLASDEGIKYSTSLGSSTLSLGAFTSANNNTVATGVADNPDVAVGLATSMGAVALNVVGVYHQVESTTGTAVGSAAVGTASVNFGAGKAYLIGGTSRGALGHTGTLNSMADSDGAAANLATGTSFAGGVNVGIGSGSLELNAGQISTTLAATKNTEQRYSVSYAVSVAKGLTVTPEFYAVNSDYNGAKSTSNSAYLRINRDF